MADNIETKVREKIAEQLGVAADEVKPDSSFIEDLGADSLDIVAPRSLAISMARRTGAA